MNGLSFYQTRTCKISTKNSLPAHFKKCNTIYQSEVLNNEVNKQVDGIRGVRSRLFWTPAPVLTNQTPDPAPGQ